jgi:hypothetical protein
MKSKLLNKYLPSIPVLFIFLSIAANKSAMSEVPAKLAMKAPPVENCKVCDSVDTHKISLDSVLDLIVAFDSVFVRRGFVKNSGGILDFDSLDFNGGVNNDTSYATFKLHWAYETQEAINRLSVTCELSIKNCVKNVYDGDSGIEGPSLNTAAKENDFMLKKALTDTLTKLAILKHFTSSKAYVTKPGPVLIDTKYADSLLTVFKNATSILSGAYEGCDDIVYKKNASYDQIVAATNMSAVRYYFGYDNRASINYKLRLILVGINKAGNLVIFDASDNFLMREISRPRP